MAIPTYQDYYPYILKHADKAQTADQYLELIISDLDISEQDQKVKNASGEPTIRNRLRWGIHYLRHAKLLDKPDRGKFKITDRGKKVRKEKGLNITEATLMEFDEFKEFKRPKKSVIAKNVDSKNESLTPIERLELLSNSINREVKEELMSQIMSLSPYFFEKLVVDLLKKMGYGSFQGTTVTNKSNDNGIDGIVYQDELGLDIVYIQAKRYAVGSNVGRPDLQSFIGALDTIQATKGVFFTTSGFTASVAPLLEKSTKKVVTVDGDKLLDLLVQYEVGIDVATVHKSYKIDEGYFSE